MSTMPTFSSLSVGDSIPPLDLMVPRSQLVRYAGASGDFNPIHWNARVAQGVGLPDVIAHGMLTMALACRAITDWTGSPASVVEYSVRFTRPVVVPDDDIGALVGITGVIGAVDQAARSVRVDLTVRVAGATVLGKGRAVVRLP